MKILEIRLADALGLLIVGNMLAALYLGIVDTALPLFLFAVVLLATDRIMPQDYSKIAVVNLVLGLICVAWARFSSTPTNGIGYYLIFLVIVSLEGYVLYQSYQERVRSKT